jgi:hypothetical protein
MAGGQVARSILMQQGFERDLFFPNVSGRRGGWPKPDSDSQIRRLAKLCVLKPSLREFQPIVGGRSLADVCSSVSKA